MCSVDMRRGFVRVRHMNLVSLHTELVVVRAVGID